MHIEIGIIFAFGAMLFWGVGDFLIQKTTRKIGGLEALAWISIIGSLGILPFVWKDLGLLKNTHNLILILGLGIVTFIAGKLAFEAFKDGKISVVDVVLEMELPVTIALSFFFLKESLSMMQIVIILFIFFGIILIATKSFSHLKTKIEKGVLLAFIAALFMGGVDFLTGVSSKTITPLLAIWGQSIVVAIICIIWVLFRERPSSFFKNTMDIKMLILWMSIIDTSAWVFYAFAVRNNEIAIMTAITESYPAIAICLGVWLNKERIMMHQWLGAAMALACSILLSLTV
jgi:bacterial/archaeal transporter family protein